MMAMPTTTLPTMRAGAAAHGVQGGGAHWLHPGLPRRRGGSWPGSGMRSNARMAARLTPKASRLTSGMMNQPAVIQNNAQRRTR